MPKITYIILTIILLVAIGVSSYVLLFQEGEKTQETEEQPAPEKRNKISEPQKQTTKEQPQERKKDPETGISVPVEYSKVTLKGGAGKAAWWYKGINIDKIDSWQSLESAVEEVVETIERDLKEGIELYFVGVRKTKQGNQKFRMMAQTQKAYQQKYGILIEKKTHLEKLADQNDYGIFICLDKLFSAREEETYTLADFKKRSSELLPFDLQWKDVMISPTSRYSGGISLEIIEEKWPGLHYNWVTGEELK